MSAVNKTQFDAGLNDQQKRQAQQKWDQRHQHGQCAEQPARVLAEYADLLPQSGEALDLASGLGRNARFLVKRALTTHAWDFSPMALTQIEAWSKQTGVNLHLKCIDLEQDFEFPQQFDVIVVSAFLYRPLLSKLPLALRPNGLLFYQTFSQTPDLQDQSKLPTNPNFVLKSGELAESFASLTPLVDSQTPDGQALYIGRRLSR